MTSDEEELNRLSVQAQILQQQGQSLQGQLEAMQQSIADLNTTIETLENLSKVKDDSRLPIGSGVYLACQKVDSSQVFVSIGAGLIVSKKPAEAEALLRKRLATINQSFETAQRNMVALNKQLEDINNTASALASRIEDVRPTEG
ncbi:MAG: prefoldin subunit alpha [Candidatus Micrarchaeota archaeon]